MRMRSRFTPTNRMLLAIALWLAVVPLVAAAAHAQAPVVVKPVAFGESDELRDLSPAEDKPTEEPEEEKDIPMRVFRTELPDAAPTEDPVLQESVPEALTPTPSLFFGGLTSDDNAAAFGGRVMPPDTVGDVGPNHYVQMVNNLFRVFDKAGNPLTAKLTIGSLFVGAGISAACANTNDGDPIVLYDPLADRWLMSQFCTVANPNNHQLIAISKTSDPAGAYYLYDFMMPNNKFNDYPKFGVWTDAYYMTDNQFNQAGTAFLGAGAFAFDRAKMLAGDPTASYIYFDVENGNPDIGGMLPTDLDGLTPPPAGTPNYFVYFTADEFGDPSDALRVFEFHPNFATPAASTFTERADSPILVAAFDPRSPSGRDDIEQPPPATSGAFLDGIMDRLMFRLAYRSFGTYEALVVTHTVNVSGVSPTTPANLRAGIRYYELRRNLPGGTFTVNEQATFAPADGLERWMGSAAMDGSGNLAVGYSASSLTSFPSMRYAGRLATDPPGGLTQGETVMVAGTGAQTATQSRWGDYSALSVDPDDDCTFWFTSEYYTAASAATSSFGWVTGIGRFTFSECTPAATGTITGTVVNSATSAPIPGATVMTSNGFSRITDAAGTYSMKVPAGTYDMAASAPGYTSAAATGVTVSTGGTTVQSFALGPMPILKSGTGASIVAESCGTGNGAIDPGETVTVSLPVTNTGTAATVNLVGTLLAGGGVTSPGPPQTYGAIPVAGTVSRSFTFVAAGTCGGTVTASLQLQDGATNLGTVTYTFTLGQINPYPLPAVSYSSGNLSVPLPDVSTVEVPLAVTDTGVVSDVNVRIRLNHTFDGDLNISLIGPDGTTIDLSSGNGSSGDNYGSGANDCSGQPTVFDDSATASITAGTAPFAGTFKPEQALSAFNGKPTAGTWKLRIADTANVDVGTLFCFQLEIVRRAHACCGGSGTPVPQGFGSAVTAESCSPHNGAIDPDELVTVDFALVNAGSGDTTNLVATLLPTGGVQQPGGPQSYGVIQAGGPAVSRSFSFVPAGTCGGNVTATLHLQDGTLDLGNITFTLRLGSTASASYGPFANAASITIPAGAPTTTSGAAAPYPSNVSVSGITGTVSKVTVTLTNVNHTFPDDVDMLLVGPAGQKVILMSDAGGSNDLVNVNLTFDDAGPALPDSALIASGTFRPTNFGTGDTFPAPAPAAPYGAALADFAGTNPNGTWSLYVTDDAGADIGSIAGGWSLNFLTADPVCCDQACSLACPAPITVPTEPNVCQAAVTFPFPGVTGSCGTLACVPPSGSVFPLGTTTDVCTATRQSGATTTCSFPITVQDLQGPVISGVSASPSVLWPPDHMYQNITVNYTAADNCSGSPAISCSLSVTSNEPLNGLGDGDTAPDWQVVSSHLVKLRRERGGLGTGRIYTITITCTDQAGRTSSQTVNVTVPLSQ
ncbi:MAG TPA: proprotein convertase P-domain-containing protein [Thermoanaerobaculia bacterium]|jgi:subtilisin-like proprotein convertase family protein|nr:proprotein convertase P-domain-containing protein [Thermoanaerobaculia bacterium]